MSTLSSILDIATSGLQVAQTGLNTVSNNVSNVGTAGYVREVVNPSALSVGGQGMGVTVADITRATNQFLEAANRKAQSDTGSAAISSSMLDQAQSLFGNPTSTQSFFSQLDGVFSAFSTLSTSPSSSAKTAAVAQVSQFLSSAKTIGSGLSTLSSQADTQITSDVASATTLLSQISKLNSQISQAKVSGGDVTGAQNTQSGLITKLTALMDVNVTSTATGGVTVRASDGTLLASDGGSANLSYDTSSGTGQILVTPVGGVQQALGSRLTSGELGGLITLRNTDLPQMRSQLSTLVAATAKGLNAVSNAYSSTPAPSTFTGRNTGQDLAAGITGFTGKSTVAIVDGGGVSQAQVAIDFSAGTMSLNGGAAVSFTPASFVSTLNGQLGSLGSASFAGGALSISATGANGVAIADTAASPSAKAGKSFSGFFGLNDLVTSTSPTTYDTGLTTASASGFPAGQAVSFNIAAADGSTLKTVTVATPSGGTMADLLATLNDRASGVGLYGSFGLDANGQLGFTPTPGSGVSLSVKSDATANSTGTSFSTLFGVGDATRTAAQTTYGVRADILADPNKLQTAQTNLSAGVGATVLNSSDVSAADAFAQASRAKLTFDTALGAPAVATTLTQYASTLSGSVAAKVAAVDAKATLAASVASETSTRLSSAEGVNIDTELVSLTTYQQAYSASARLIQASKDMFTTLLTMSGG